MNNPTPADEALAREIAARGFDACERRGKLSEDAIMQAALPLIAAHVAAQAPSGLVEALKSAIYHLKSVEKDTSYSFDPDFTPESERLIPRLQKVLNEAQPSEWVCEAHPDKSWPEGCNCSAGMLRSDAHKAQPVADLRGMVEVEKGAYVLATEFSDGDPGDPWAVGFYREKTPWGRHIVEDSNGNVCYGPNGFRAVRAGLTEEFGKWLVENMKTLEKAPPGSINLWGMLGVTAFEDAESGEVKA